VEDESGDKGGDNDGDQGWGPEDDAPVSPVHGGPDLEVNEEEHDPVAEPRRSTREKKGVPPVRFIEQYVAAANLLETPNSVREALGGPDKEKWKAAIQSEMDNLRQNGVFELVERKWLTLSGFSKSSWMQMGI
jgi:hypothetical protein